MMTSNIKMLKNKLTYQDYCNFHAGKCNICNGNKTIFKSNIWITCGCQYNAKVKWRFDQIKVYPEELKYKTWEDFNGIGNIGRLTIESFADAKEKAIEYCFNSKNPDVIKNRKNHLYLHKRLSEGKNLIIAGPNQSGKSLIATLILKELVYLCVIKNINIDFQWVKYSDIIHAARWSGANGVNYKSIENDYLDDLSQIDFLFIDGLDMAPPFGDHRQPPDILSINRLFSNRLSLKLPTILISSLRILECIENNVLANDLIHQAGEQLFELLMKNNNTIIKLQRMKN